MRGRIFSPWELFSMNCSPAILRTKRIRPWPRYTANPGKVPPPIELVPEIPKPLNAIVVRCLEIDKNKRYASATEILTDLELWLGPRAGTRIVVANKRPWARVPSGPQPEPRLSWPPELSLF